MRGLTEFTGASLEEIHTAVLTLHTADADGHTPWTGDAADAYARNHTQWMDGAKKMRDGLATMEAALKSAEDAYTAGADEVARILGRGGRTRAGR